LFLSLASYRARLCICSMLRPLPCPMRARCAMVSTAKLSGRDRELHLPRRNLRNSCSKCLLQCEAAAHLGLCPHQPGRVGNTLYKMGSGQAECGNVKAHDPLGSRPYADLPTQSECTPDAPWHLQPSWWTEPDNCIFRGKVLQQPQQLLTIAAV